MTMRKLTPIIALLVSLPLSASAGGIRPGNLDGALAMHKFCFPLPVPAAVATDNTMGTDGVLSDIALPTYSTFGVQTQTSSIGSLPTPMGIEAIIHDVNGNDTLTCSIQVEGINQFGRKVSETIAATESAVDGTHVYAKITKVKTVMGSCADGTDATDAVVVRVDPVRVGLQRKIRAKTDVLSACISDDSGSDAVMCAAYGQASTELGIEDMVSLTNYTIDVTQAAFGNVGGTEVAAADTDNVCIMVLPSL